MTNRPSLQAQYDEVLRVLRESRGPAPEQLQRAALLKAMLNDPDFDPAKRGGDEADLAAFLDALDETCCETIDEND